MQTNQIKQIKIGTILNWKDEKLVVTGFNRFSIKEGTAKIVTGLECDENGQYSNDSMPSIYRLEECTIN
jgi:hypothetical protein